MGLDFTTRDAETAAIRSPRGAAIVLALVAAAVAGLFVFGVSSTGAVGLDGRGGLSSPLSIPLSIPWDGSVTVVNESGETRDMTLSCGGGDDGAVAASEALSVTSIMAVDDRWCTVTARLSAPLQLSIDSDRFTWCTGEYCSFQFRPGEDVKLAVTAPVERPEPRRDLSAPYLRYQVWSYVGQHPGVAYHDVLGGAWPYMSVAIDPDSLEVVIGPNAAKAWVTSDRRIAVEVSPGTEVPLDRLRYRLCGVDGRCAEDDLTLRFAQAPNPVDATWKVPAEANPGIGWLDRSDPNFVPYWVRPSFEVLLIDPPDFGTATILHDGRQFAYDPAEGFKGVDSFTYRVCDMEGLCGDATVTLLVGGADKPKKRTDPLTDEELKKIALDKLADQPGEEWVKDELIEIIEGPGVKDELVEIIEGPRVKDELVEDIEGPRVKDLLIEIIEPPHDADPRIWTGERLTKSAADAADCTITGTDGDDLLIGTPGPDVICGLGGDDVILGRGGNDVLRGGPGEDKLNGGPGHDHLSGDTGRDELDGKAGTDHLRGGTGPDDLRGGKGSDRMWGDAGGDVLRGNDGHDRMRGGKGDDILLGGGGKDSARGGAGADRIWGGKGDDHLRGDAGRDVIFGKDGEDRVDGGSGEDQIGWDGKIR